MNEDQKMERAMAEVQLEKDGYSHAERIAILADGWSEPTNEDRATRAEQTARYYCELVGQSYEDDGPDTAVTDLLVDIMHWCDRNEQTFDDLVRRADNHYACEVAEEAEDAEDVEQPKQALAAGEKTIPWQDAKDELGL